jgi:hypothetical protein
MEVIIVEEIKNQSQLNAKYFSVSSLCECNFIRFIYPSFKMVRSCMEHSLLIVQVRNYFFKPLKRGNVLKLTTIAKREKERDRRKIII